tara:strand:+ start:531 stop:761 length:231 start_codon:yes stop_codon:yes gene_type:complete
MKEHKRIVNYLTRRYDQLSEKKLKFELNRIMERLLQTGKWEPEFLEDVLERLQDKEGWSKPRVVAYLDTLDIIDRT